MEYTLITGANDPYILTLLDFITHYVNQKLDPSKLVVYDLGLNQKNMDLLTNYNSRLFAKFAIKKLDYSLYPEHVDLNKNKGIYCSYAFKPIIIYNEVQNTNHPILWLDSANRFNINILIKIIDTITKEGFYSPVSNIEKTIESIELNHPKTCELLGVNEYEHTNLLKSRSGNIIGLNYSSQCGKKLLDDWYNYCLQKEVIMPEGSSRNNHRQDQTVISLLMFLYEKQHGIKFETRTFEVSHWNKKDPPIVEDLHFKYRLIDKESMNQIAIVYAKTLDDAIQIYSDRKRMKKENFMNHYIVDRI
jgi:hypothetical protein